jgi:hypothetical protein
MLQDVSKVYETAQKSFLNKTSLSKKLSPNFYDFSKESLPNPNIEKNRSSIMSAYLG